MLRKSWIAVPTAILLVAVTLFAKPQAATLPTSDLTHWLVQLADDDPNVRDTARVNLMGLKRDDLDLLRAAVEQHQPLAPAQAGTLRDIVFHVYLSGEEYEKLPMGFMGVMLQEVRQPIIAPGDDAADEAARWSERVGVQVAQRVPGFCGFRFLKESDIIIGVVGQDIITTAENRELTELVKKTAPGETITLAIIRQGKPMRIAFRVDARPVEADVRNQVEEFRNPRMAKAQEYWDKNFAPLLAGKLS